MDLFALTPNQISQLMESYTDPSILRALARLEHAAITGDEWERVAAAGDLSDVLILERGGW